jgi:hypothetical protein
MKLKLGKIRVAFTNKTKMLDYYYGLQNFLTLRNDFIKAVHRHV